MFKHRDSQKIITAFVTSLPVVLLLLLTPIASQGKTLYVAKYGDISATCSKTDPCPGIQLAINAAADRDKIIVGPGDYYDNLDFDKAGLKLESIAGRYATTVIAHNIGNPVVNITQPKVQIGKKGKGFTLTGSTVGRGAIYITQSFSGTPALKIEGNRIGHPRLPTDPADQYANLHGIFLLDAGRKVSIRYNHILNNEGYGLLCGDCSNAIIQDNRIENNGDQAIYAGNSVDSALTLRRNMVSANLFGGVNLFNTGSRLKYTENVVERNLDFGTYVSNTAGGLFMGNIVAKNGSTANHQGMHVIQTVYDRPIQIKHNLLLGNTGDGLQVQDAENVKLLNNTAQDNGNDGMELFSTAVVSTLKNNSSIRNAFCGIRGDGVSTYSISKQFNSGNADTTCDTDFSGTPAATPAPTNVKKAAGLVGG